MRVLFPVLTVFVLVAGMSAAEEPAPVASISDSDSHRLATHTVVPKYPKKARRDRIEGEVQVCFDIDRKGRTRRIAVRRSTDRAFERPSIKAVRASTFLPLKPEEPLQAIKSCRTFVFSLVPVENQASR